MTQIGFYKRVRKIHICNGASENHGHRA